MKYLSEASKRNPEIVSQYLLETFGKYQKLDEKSLFKSMDSQLNKTMKAIKKQIAEFDKAKETIEEEKKKLLDEIGGEKAFDKPVFSYSAAKLKKVSNAKAAVELLLGIETVRASLEEAEKILTDDFFISFCKKIDDNTTLFGKSKGKLTANGKDLTSKNVKIVDKDKKANLDTHKLHKKARKEETVLNEDDPEDVSKDYKKFQKQMDKLSLTLANAGQITEMLQSDPEMQRVAKESNVKFNSVLGVLAIAGMVLRMIPTPPTQLAGRLMTSGSMLTRAAPAIVKTAKSSNLSVTQKLLRMSPAIASAVMASFGLGAVAKALSANLENVDSLEDVVDTDTVEDTDVDNEVSDEGSDEETLDVSDDEDNEPDSDTDEETDIEADTDEEPDIEDNSEIDTEDDLGEPTIENSIAAQAAAKVGDILQRNDGTKVRLTQGDIDWAKNIVKEEPDIGEATVEETDDIDNPVFDAEEHPEIEVEDTDTDDSDNIESEDTDTDVSDNIEPENTDTDDSDNIETEETPNENEEEPMPSEVADKISNVDIPEGVEEHDDQWNDVFDNVFGKPTYKNSLQYVNGVSIGKVDVYKDAGGIKGYTILHVPGTDKFIQEIDPRYVYDSEKDTVIEDPARGDPSLLLDDDYQSRYISSIDFFKGFQHIKDWNPETNSFEDQSDTDIEADVSDEQQTIDDLFDDEDKEIIDDFEDSNVTDPDISTEDVSDEDIDNALAELDSTDDSADSSVTEEAAKICGISVEDVQRISKADSRWNNIKIVEFEESEDTRKDIFDVLNHRCIKEDMVNIKYGAGPGEDASDEEWKEWSWRECIANASVGYKKFNDHSVAFPVLDAKTNEMEWLGRVDKTGAIEVFDSEGKSVIKIDEDGNLIEAIPELKGRKFIKGIIDIAWDSYYKYTTY